MEYPKLSLSLLLAVSLSAAFLIGWELHWRSKPDYYHANINDDRNLWAEHRAKVEDATKDDVVILGASRTGFGFRTSVWESVQGITPINLSTDGKTPTPFLVDIVENTSFNGTIVFGVAALSAFASPKGSVWWKDAMVWPDHYKNQTYASKLSFFISKILQRELVMLSSSELNFYNDLDLKSLINTIPLTGRAGEPNTLPKFGYNDYDRNLIMFPRMTKNPVHAKPVTDTWVNIFKGIEEFKDEILQGAPENIDIYVEHVKKFKARGGKIIFIRHKSERIWDEVESMTLPRALVWDKFVEQVGSPAYHFLDHPFMNQYTLPEWSHLSDVDAHTYTYDMVNRLIKDGHLTRH